MAITTYETRPIARLTLGLLSSWVVWGALATPLSAQEASGSDGSALTATPVLEFGVSREFGFLYQWEEDARVSPVFDLGVMYGDPAGTTWGGTIRPGFGERVPWSAEARMRRPLEPGFTLDMSLGALVVDDRVGPVLGGGFIFGEVVGARFRADGIPEYTFGSGGGPAVTDWRWSGDIRLTGQPGGYVVGGVGALGVVALIVNTVGGFGEVR